MEGWGERGGKGSRTPDLLIANETLYQLSYAPNIEYSNPWLGTLKPTQWKVEFHLKPFTSRGLENARGAL